MSVESSMTITCDRCGAKITGSQVDHGSGWVEISVEDMHDLAKKRLDLCWGCMGQFAMFMVTRDRWLPPTPPVNIKSAPPNGAGDFKSFLEAFRRLEQPFSSAHVAPIVKAMYPA